MFNYFMAMKLDADQIQEKHKYKNPKHGYKTNHNVLFGLIKFDMPDLLSNNPQERSNAVKRILNTIQSNLVEKNIEEMTEILTEQPKIQITNSSQHKEEVNKKNLFHKNFLN